MNKYIESTMQKYAHLDKSTLLTVPEPELEWEEAECDETAAAINIEDTLFIITQHDRDSLK